MIARNRRNVASTKNKLQYLIFTYCSSAYRPTAVYLLLGSSFIHIGSSPLADPCLSNDLVGLDDVLDRKR